MISKDSKPRFEALRIGRESRPFARYFVTCCTLGRKKTLADAHVAEAIFRQWTMMHDEGKIRLGCGVIMPDHVHFLFAPTAHIAFRKSSGGLRANLIPPWRETKPNGSRIISSIGYALMNPGKTTHNMRF